jgi:Family of unknown function (DUF6340)
MFVIFQIRLKNLNHKHTMITLRSKDLIIALSILSLTSCTTMQYTSLDVLKPAKVSFNVDANNILIANNSIIQPADLGHKTHAFNENEKNNTVKTDSLSIYCLGALTQELEAKNFFNSVQLSAKSMNRQLDFNRISPLKQDSIQNLCKRYNSNVILSLDKIFVEDQLSELYAIDNNDYLSSIEVKVKTFWSIRYPGSNQQTNVTFNDTVYWQSTGETNAMATFKLPKRQDALVDAALNVGKKMTNRLIPYWEKADRYFFIYPNKQLKQGMDSVYVKNWKGAITIWESLIAKNKNSYLQAIAKNNLAICYELDGNIEKAFDYATQAYYGYAKQELVNFDELSRVSEYMNELAIRKGDIDNLKKQLGK